MPPGVAPFILAENFDGLYRLIFGLIVGLVLLAAGSFIASARGHWSGVVMAAPAVGLGALLFFSAAAGHAPAGLLFLFVLPAVLGIGSIGLYAERRRR
jgi:hypothetical protein